MFKRVMIGLFAISVVAMLGTEANADCPFNFTYCYDGGGTEVCGCYNAGAYVRLQHYLPEKQPSMRSFRYDVKLWVRCQETLRPAATQTPTEMWHERALSLRRCEHSN